MHVTFHKIVQENMSNNRACRKHFQRTYWYSDWDKDVNVSFTVSIVLAKPINVYVCVEQVFFRLTIRTFSPSAHEINASVSNCKE